MRINWIKLCSISILLICLTLLYSSLSVILVTVRNYTLRSYKCSDSPIDIDVSSLQCPFSSLHEVTMNGKPEGPIVVTYANKGWLPIVHNWIKHTKEAGINRTLVIALSEGVCTKIRKIYAYCWYPNISGVADLGISSSSHQPGASWGDQSYIKLMRARTPILYALLKCNREVLSSDSDVIFINNPVKYLKSVISNSNPKVDILLQKDSLSSEGLKLDTLDWLGEKGWLGDFYACAGFMYLRPTKASLSLLAMVIAYQELDWNDQAGINVCLRMTRTVNWKTLPSDLFPNGRILKRGVKRGDNSKPYIYHFNGMFNMKHKIRGMKKMNLWKVTYI